MKCKILKLSVHIVHYDSDNSASTGKLNKKKIYYLKKTIASYKKIKTNTHIFVHTNSKKKLPINVNKIFYHNLKKEDALKGYLTWKPRKIIEKQINKYDAFIYTENDIFFNQKNLNYWKKYKDICNENKFGIGFVLCEKNIKKKLYSICLLEKFKFFKQINSKKFIIASQPYCGFWIYSNNELKKFINTKWWKFNWKGKNYLDFYGITEMSAIGLNGPHMDSYKAILIPTSKKNFLDSGCFVTHLTNNYFGKQVLHRGKLHLRNKYTLKNIVEKDKNQISWDSFERKIFFLKKKIKFIFRFINKIKIK